MPYVVIPVVWVIQVSDTTFEGLKEDVPFEQAIKFPSSRSAYAYLHDGYGINTQFKVVSSEELGK